ncbi:Vitellogenin [Bagarius yarrelli]|uniref:Vitellogenin n=1 Tax=Bagarius yarrelli TaxID=175774 RepID=A0A556U5J9_BAGYA|nr:Vitellogenin [Bagarius yarrelli]
MKPANTDVSKWSSSNESQVFLKDTVKALQKVCYSVLSSKSTARGILNILQLNLKNTQNVYELHEAGPQGICKTHYMISEDVKTHQIVVRKSKDLTNCHERVIGELDKLYGLLLVVPVPVNFPCVGVRTEGLQEALQKTSAAEENADRITKIKRTIKALMDWKSLQTTQPLASIFVKVLGQEIAFANIEKTFIQDIMEKAVQYATGPRPRELLKEAVKALQKGIAFQYAKPLLAAEVRRILPSSIGLPMELGYYTAAVAAASVNVQATITPSLPENPEALNLDQLMKTDIQLQAEARPSIALQTFAVIGVNTALIQAAVMVRGKIHTVLPGKVAISADLPKGIVKMEALPAAVPDHIAAVRFETVAVARNIEDLPNERVVSLAPPMPSDAAEMWIPASVQKSLCAVVPYINIKGCFDVDIKHAGFMGYNPLYYIVGQHSARISVRKDDGPALERLELEVQVGAKAAEKLVKEISVVNTDITEESTIMLKLREILEAGLRHINSTSGSSSYSASSSRSISSSKSVSSSSSMSSARVQNSYGQFKKFHRDQYLVSQAMSKASSASSIEAIRRKANLLGDSIPPAFAIIARVVRADRKLGYQIAAYLDKPTSRVQVVFDSIAESDKWRICADALLPSKHKVAARFAIGEQCQEYAVTAKAETGLHEAHPAGHLEWGWNREPRILTIAIPYVKRAMNYIPQVAPMAGVNADRAENNERMVKLIVALPTQKSLNILMHIPKMTLSKLAMPLPVAVPIEQDGTIPALNRLINIDIRASVEKFLNYIRES